MPGAEEKLWPVACSLWPGGQRDSGVPWRDCFSHPYKKFYFLFFSYRSMFSFGKSAEMRSEDLKAVEWSWKFVKLQLLNYN